MKTQRQPSTLFLLEFADDWTKEGYFMIYDPRRKQV